MNSTRVILGVYMVAVLVCFIEPAAGENYPVILRGKVMMPDGSPPPITVAIERICSDMVGSAPGPLTNKKGEYVWRMDVDPMRTRSCVLRATHSGYISSSIDISALHGYLSTTVDLDPIILTSPADDPYSIIMSDSDIPGRARSATKKAMKALDVPDYPEARRQFQAAVQADPKFALGWHALGVLLERESAMKDAREAYERAIESDSKMLPAYMTLTHLCMKTKDWGCAVKAADGLIKADNKHHFPDIYLHRAVSMYGLKDLAGAEASVLEAIRMDPNHLRPRAEYVYGRILEAKGDIEGARTHISRYLELDKNAPDPKLIQLHLENLGKPGTAGTEPELEYP